MDWQLIEYNTFPGQYNMQFDLDLVRNFRSNQPILRFYGWNPYCISIGANQSFNEINIANANSNNIEIVKRPTGGRAILHAEELTYSVVIPSSNNISGKLIYEEISNAIVYGLRNYNIALSKVELEELSPNFPNLLKEPTGSLCFASTAKNEIKYNGKKLVGSAQRKIGSTILQHGSILIGKFHQNLIKYLNINEKYINKLEDEISNRTTEISTILNEDVDIRKLQDAIVFGFESVLKAKFQISAIKSIPL